VTKYKAYISGEYTNAMEISIHLLFLSGVSHPGGLIAPLYSHDWETALTVILHSPHYTKRSVNSMEDLPLHVAIKMGAPRRHDDERSLQ
jgi:hypothetical protein